MVCSDELYIFYSFLHVIKACQPNRLMSPTNTLYPRKDKKARGVHHLYMDGRGLGHF